MSSSDTYTFAGVPFVAVLGGSGETPHWKPKLDATDRPLIGTDRFERSIRSRTWSLDLELWIEPADTASSAFHTLLVAYAFGTVADLTAPGDPPPAPVLALLLTFDVTPQRGGIDGYRGKATFGQVGGAA